MSENYSIIGPDVYMDKRGRLYRKADDQTYIPIQSKYIEAEDRYIQKQLEKKGWDMLCQKAL